MEGCWVALLEDPPPANQPVKLGIRCRRRFQGEEAINSVGKERKQLGKCQAVHWDASSALTRSEGGSPR